MSNAKKPARKTFDLTRYRAEAKGEPFVLHLGDDKTLEIPRPNADQMFEAEEYQRFGTSKQVVKAMCGDKADEFFDVLGTEDMAVMQAIVTDMQEFFGAGEPPASRG